MKEKSNKKVVVGMSGGVDSSVSLLLLKNGGYKPIGVSLKYDVWKDKCNSCEENVCCSKKSFAIAKNICNKLGVAHHIVDVSREFKKEVIDYFTKELKANRTPSPCVFCNPKVKFKSLLDFADKVGAGYVATGHYARVRAVKSEKHALSPSASDVIGCNPISQKGLVTGLKVKSQDQKIQRYELLKSKDEEKDQTYSLSFLTQKELSRIIFPLRELTKTQVYGIAKKQKGFEVFEKCKQSQDFCFISGNSIPKFLQKEIGIKKGEIINDQGKKLGEHRGLHFYTIGQRKGIGVGGTPPVASAKGGPYYVVEKDIATNTLIISQNRTNFSKKEIILKPFNIISGDRKIKNIEVTAKLRSSAKANEATVSRVGDELLLKFKNSQDSVTPGQIAVFYLPAERHGDDDVCLGGGVIISKKLKVESVKVKP